MTNETPTPGPDGTLPPAAPEIPVFSPAAAIPEAYAAEPAPEAEPAAASARWGARKTGIAVALAAVLTTAGAIGAAAAVPAGSGVSDDGGRMNGPTFQNRVPGGFQNRQGTGQIPPGFDPNQLPGLQQLPNQSPQDPSRDATTSGDTTTI